MPGFCGTCINAWSTIIRMADRALTALGGEAMYKVLKPFDFAGQPQAQGQLVALPPAYAAFCIDSGLVEPVLATQAAATQAATLKTTVRPELVEGLVVKKSNRKK